MAPPTGAQIIARSLRDIGVTVIFGIVGIPVVEIAEEAINLGIKFIGFRNEQAASYAASAYGYLTGRPGVCLVVGGPGVLHGMAGVSICICISNVFMKPNHYSDWQCKRQCIPSPSPRRLLRNPPRFSWSIPRTRRHLPPHTPHKARSTASNTRIDTRRDTKYI